MIIMSIFPYMLGIAFLLLFKGIVGQDCITQQFSNQNSVVNLNCSISPFSGTGSWTVDGVGPKTNCAANSFCTTTVDGNYTFTSDSYGIYVKIDPFLTDEIGKIWKCEHAPSINCNIALSGPTTSPAVSTPEEASTTINVRQMTSSQNPFTTSHSETTGTILGTTADYGLTSTSWRVTSEVTKPKQNDKTVGTIIAFVIPVGIFLLMISIMIFIFIRLRRSKRMRTKKVPNERIKHKKMVTRNQNSNEDIFYLNERKSPTLTREFHRKKRFNKKEHYNSFNYPLRYHEPYSSHWSTLYNDRRRPDRTNGQTVLYGFMGYSIYQGNVKNRNDDLDDIILIEERK